MTRPAVEAASANVTRRWTMCHGFLLPAHLLLHMFTCCSTPPVIVCFSLLSKPEYSTGSFKLHVNNLEGKSYGFSLSTAKSLDPANW